MTRKALRKKRNNSQKALTERYLKSKARKESKQESIASDELHEFLIDQDEDRSVEDYI